MAVVAAIVRSGVPGDLRENVVDLTLDGSYPAGGYPITPAQFGLSSLDMVHLSGIRQGSAAGNGLGWEWDHVNSKLKAWKGNGAAVLTEAAAGDITTSTVLRVVARGRA